MRKYISFILLFALTFVFAIGFTAPAYAAGLDYNDYIDYIVVDGDNQLVTLRLPLNHTWTQARVNGSVVSQGANNTVTWLSRDEGEQNVIWSFVRTTATAEANRLDLAYIPEGSLFSVGSYWDISESTVNPTLRLALYAYDYGATSGPTSSSSASVRVHPQTMEYVSATLRKPPGASTLNLTLTYSGFLAVSEGAEVQQTFTISEVLCTISIPSLVREQEEAGRTNKILQAVEQKLEENGQKLDDILSGDSLTDPSVPDWTEIDESVDSKLEAIEDSFQFVVPVVPDIGGMIDSQAALAVGATVAPLLQNPTFLSLLIAGLSLSLMAYVLFGKR